MTIDDDIMEELLDVAQTLWEWLPIEKRNQLPLFKAAIGKASFAFREAKKIWESNTSDKI